MPTLQVECRTERELRLVQQAIAFIAEMHDLALSAPEGQVLHLCEALALDQGRQVLRDTLQSAVQACVDSAEEKGARPASARVPAATTSKGGIAGN